MSAISASQKRESPRKSRSQDRLARASTRPLCSASASPTSRPCKFESLKSTKSKMKITNGRPHQSLILGRLHIDTPDPAQADLSNVKSSIPFSRIDTSQQPD